MYESTSLKALHKLEDTKEEVQRTLTISNRQKNLYRLYQNDELIDSLTVEAQWEVQRTYTVKGKIDLRLVYERVATIKWE